MGKWGEIMNYRRNRREAGEVDRVARRPEDRLAFGAVRTAVAAELKRLDSNVLQEPIPDGMAELLKHLDEPRKDDKKTNDS